MNCPHVSIIDLLDEMSRYRALTDDESHLLESALNAKYRRRAPDKRTRRRAAA